MTAHPELIDPDLVAHLVRIGTFSVDTCDSRSEGDERIAAHTKIIRPLVTSAVEAYAWPAAKSVEAVDYPAEVLIREKGRYRFDLRKECVTGYEVFWNATAWQRGSIALRLAKSPAAIEAILAHCADPGVMSSRYQLEKGYSRAAIRFCDECVAAGDLAFCFSASNGIQFLSVFAPTRSLLELFQIATAHCTTLRRAVTT